MITFPLCPHVVERDRERERERERKQAEVTGLVWGPRASKCQRWHFNQRNLSPGLLPRTTTLNSLNTMEVTETGIERMIMTESVKD